MKLRFTKMQGAGNDFVVLDATRAPLPLGPELLQRLGDRRFGVGADQILVVEKTDTPGVDFRYRIFNAASGQEVEHCGNGARCFVRYVREHGLSDRDVIRVETMNNRLELRLQADGRVTVDMNQPIFDGDRVPFDAAGLKPRLIHGFELWPLELDAAIASALRQSPAASNNPGVVSSAWASPIAPTAPVEVAVLSMGNPHAVMRVEDVETAPVALLGPWLEQHRRFPRKVNAGFMQVMARASIRLRVYERDAGETLACGTGACAAVVAGIRLGWLDARVDVHTRGGLLTIEWAGLGSSVMMTGPAETVFEGEITL